MDAFFIDAFDVEITDPYRAKEAVSALFTRLVDAGRRQEALCAQRMFEALISDDYDDNDIIEHSSQVQSAIIAAIYPKSFLGDVFAPLLLALAPYSTPGSVSVGVTGTDDSWRATLIVEDGELQQIHHVREWVETGAPLF